MGGTAGTVPLFLCFRKIGETQFLESAENLALGFSKILAATGSDDCSVPCYNLRTSDERNF
ncbi:MAG: hypothetical protein DMG83_10450 [Acidobacteria bacterium]|nr:MAG: hypothetical protein DMG83_10450 [Acidobacteriota bacterium]